MTVLLTQKYKKPHKSMSIIKIKYNNWGGVRDESKVIEAIQDKWCKDNGYPIKKRKIQYGRKSIKQLNERISTSN